MPRSTYIYVALDIDLKILAVSTVKYQLADLIKRHFKDLCCIVRRYRDTGGFEHATYTKDEFLNEI